MNGFISSVHFALELPASNEWKTEINSSVQVLYSNPTYWRVVQPVTWRDRPITAVIQLLFKLGGKIRDLGQQFSVTGLSWFFSEMMYIWYTVSSAPFEDYLICTVACFSTCFSKWLYWGREVRSIIQTISCPGSVKGVVLWPRSRSYRAHFMCYR